MFNPLTRKIWVLEHDMNNNHIAEVKHLNSSSGFILAPALIFCKNGDDVISADGYIKHRDDTYFNKNANDNLIFLNLVNASILRSFSCTPIKTVSCGFEHCAALTSFGTVATWGYGASGWLGHDSYTSYTSPKLVQRRSERNSEEDYLSNIISLECGGYHTWCIDSDFKVYSWGRGDVGQLGLYKDQLSNDKMGVVSMRPKQIEYFTDIPIVQVACGEAHTIVLDKWGRLFSFGWNQLGQLGQTDNNKIIKGIPKVRKIYCGAIFSLAVTENGKVYTWGSGENGQLGLGNQIKESHIPAEVGKGTELGNEQAIDAVWGNCHAIVITENGTIYGWGQGVWDKNIDGNDLNKRNSFVELKSFEIHKLDTVDSLHKLILKTEPLKVIKPKEYYSRKCSPEKLVEVSAVISNGEIDYRPGHKHNKTSLIRNHIPSSKVPFTKTPFNKM